MSFETNGTDRGTRRIDWQGVYLDSNILIYQLIGYEPLKPQLDAGFGSIDAGELACVTSELTLAELLVQPMRDDDQKQLRACLTLVDDSPYLEVVSVSREVLMKAAAIRAGSGLKLPDAIHVATAAESGCDALLTNDIRFRAVAGISVLLLSDLGES